MSEMEEILEKWQRLGQGLSMMNREAHYQALSSVKPKIVSYVSKLVDGMGADDIRSFVVLGTTFTLRKLQSDSYSGTVKAPSGDILHVFEHHSIPQIAGQVQSLFELYDDVKEDQLSDEYEKLVSRLKAEASKDQEQGLVSQLLELISPPADPKDVKAEIKEISTQALNIASDVREKKRTSTRAEDLQKLKDEVKAMLVRVEALVASQTPVRAKDDLLHQTIAEIKGKHDNLVDRSQQELNILTDRVSDLMRQLSEMRASVDEKAGAKITNIHIHA